MTEDSKAQDLKKVIDGDNQRLIRTFNKEETDKLLLLYKCSGQWDEVDIDIDGDIILSNNL